ncbi:MAG: hypothetical protein RBR30_12695 [Tenuifilaceae bacterium]|jgi:hypothetical protein|nr:hypothetical protein [Tenuifilaceae bacterium]
MKYEYSPSSSNATKQKSIEKIERRVLMDQALMVWVSITSNVIFFPHHLH